MLRNQQKHLTTPNNPNQAITAQHEINFVPSPQYLLEEVAEENESSSYCNEDLVDCTDVNLADPKYPHQEPIRDPIRYIPREEQLILNSGRFELIKNSNFQKKLKCSECNNNADLRIKDENRLVCLKHGLQLLLQDIEILSDEELEKKGILELFVSNLADSKLRMAEFNQVIEVSKEHAQANFSSNLEKVNIVFKSIFEEARNLYLSVTSNLTENYRKIQDVNLNSFEVLNGIREELDVIDHDIDENFSRIILNMEMAPFHDIMGSYEARLDESLKSLIQIKQKMSKTNPVRFEFAEKRDQVEMEELVGESLGSLVQGLIEEREVCQEAGFMNLENSEEGVKGTERSSLSVTKQSKAARLKNEAEMLVTDLSLMIKNLKADCSQKSNLAKNLGEGKKKMFGDGLGLAIKDREALVPPDNLNQRSVTPQGKKISIRFKNNQTSTKKRRQKELRRTIKMETQAAIYEKSNTKRSSKRERKSKEKKSHRKISYSNNKNLETALGTRTDLNQSSLSRHSHKKKSSISNNTSANHYRLPVERELPFTKKVSRHSNKTAKNTSRDSSNPNKSYRNIGSSSRSITKRSNKKSKHRNQLSLKSTVGLTRSQIKRRKLGGEKGSHYNLYNKAYTNNSPGYDCRLPQGSPHQLSKNNFNSDRPQYHKQRQAYHTEAKTILDSYGYPQRPSDSLCIQKDRRSTSRLAKGFKEGLLAAKDSSKLPFSRKASLNVKAGSKLLKGKGGAGASQNSHFSNSNYFSGHRRNSSKNYMYRRPKKSYKASGGELSSPLGKKSSDRLLDNHRTNSRIKMKQKLGPLSNADYTPPVIGRRLSPDHKNKSQLFMNKMMFDQTLFKAKRFSSPLLLKENDPYNRNRFEHSCRVADEKLNSLSRDRSSRDKNGSRYEACLNMEMGQGARGKGGESRKKNLGPEGIKRRMERLSKRRSPTFESR